MTDAIVSETTGADDATRIVNGSGGTDAAAERSQVDSSILSRPRKGTETGEAPMVPDNLTCAIDGEGGTEVRYWRAEVDHAASWRPQEPMIGFIASEAARADNSASVVYRDGVADGAAERPQINYSVPGRPQKGMLASPECIAVIPNDLPLVVYCQRNALVATGAEGPEIDHPRLGRPQKRVHVDITREGAVTNDLPCIINRRRNAEGTTEGAEIDGANGSLLRAGRLLSGALRGNGGGDER
jgi:hypothetical protein